MREPFLEPIVRKIRFHKAIKYITKNSIVVDIGCGHTPHLLNRLATFVGEGIGVDQFIANQKYQNIRLISGLLNKKIPVKTNYANHVTLLAVLEHIKNPTEILDECYRLLKPGGTIIITTPTPINKPVLEFLSYRLGIISVREIREHQKYYWKDDLIFALKIARFKKIRHEYFELFLNNFIVATK